jgi:hypothetical protein
VAFGKLSLLLTTYFFHVFLFDPEERSDNLLRDAGVTTQKPVFFIVTAVKTLN